MAPDTQRAHQEQQVGEAGVAENVGGEPEAGRDLELGLDVLLGSSPRFQGGPTGANAPMGVPCWTAAILGARDTFRDPRLYPLSFRPILPGPLHIS
jgi:hypothetical protein